LLEIICRLKANARARHHARHWIYKNHESIAHVFKELEIQRIDVLASTQS
jgi:hypothetical protein